MKGADDCSSRPVSIPYSESEGTFDLKKICDFSKDNSSVLKGKKSTSPTLTPVLCARKGPAIDTCSPHSYLFSHRSHRPPAGVLDLALQVQLRNKGHKLANLRVGLRLSDRPVRSCVQGPKRCECRGVIRIRTYGYWDGLIVYNTVVCI
jgi:hypothetical protein